MEKIKEYNISEGRDGRRRKEGEALTS